MLSLTFLSDKEVNALIFLKTNSCKKGKLLSNCHFYKNIKPFLTAIPDKYKDEEQCVHVDSLHT